MPNTKNPATLMSGRFHSDQIPDLSGRVAIVTGGSSGIGYYDALALARANARVLIISANEDKGHGAEAESNQALKDVSSTGTVTWYGVDFGTLKEVDALAQRLASELERLDILICNAGIGQAPYGELTNDGLERHFEVNNLAHYVFVLRLLPLMNKTALTAQPASVRIVMQSSEMHRMAPSSTKFLNKEEINNVTEKSGGPLYGRTKLGLICLARQLIKRKLSDLPPDRSIVAIAVHPGTVDTDLQRTWTEGYGKLGRVMETLSRKVGKSAEEGAENSLWAAVSTDINESNWKDFQGNYYSVPYGKSGKETKQAQDENIGDNFWNLCASLTEELLGEELQ
ncbi:uncharacterized protein C8Q71DRAFT_825550 [Rhodofomes roseus]|uniref:NAD(P)-binding protein n=1 Tax=Rhodofomes roseus TaxID=34475 RepID=A0ABQ8KWI9_9APHY|nr:uncharacterized protein C8Q71DRAFT_825550 [Rhodofomes roseus]KAH9843659.1 hypothetical protein C8Q71DRAFT_825550 [Rhodofomes roseus]